MEAGLIGRRAECKRALGADVPEASVLIKPGNCRLGVAVMAPNLMDQAGLVTETLLQKGRFKRSFRVLETACCRCIYG